MQVRQYRGKWVADYSDQFGKRHRPSFDTKREANEHLIEAKSSIMGGTFRSEASKTTVAQVANNFIDDCRQRVAIGELGASTSHNYIGHTERYILGTSDLASPTRTHLKGQFFEMPLGRFRLIDIDGDVLERFRRALLAHGLARGTVRLVLVTLSRIFELAKTKRLIAQNPVKEFRPPRSSGEGVEVGILEKDTLRKLIAVAPPYGQLLIMFAALTGVRAGEQRAIRWRDIDMEKRTARIERSVDRFGNFKTPKTKAGFRTVPLPHQLIERLRLHHESSKFAEPDDLIFASEAGQAVHHTTWIHGIYNRAWDKLKATPDGRNLRRCKWHALRHFAVSTWIEKNVPLKRIQKWAGHASPQVTLNIYAHLFEADNHAELIDEIGTDVMGEI